VIESSGSGIHRWGVPIYLVHCESTLPLAKSLELAEMETTPPEIWTEVFAFACTDGGYTGRALSMVSRDVHLISKPLKYQSVCVVGPKQLLKLLAVLSELSPGARGVKSLFVAALDESKDVEDGSTERHRRFQAHSGRDVAEQALCRILHLVSPSLLTLHIHRTTISRPSLLVEMDLPVLANLTLHGPFKSTHPASVRPRTFPSLRKINIYHFAYHPEKFLQHILHAAPLLTHLRVPQSSFSPYAIQVALGILESTEPAPEMGCLANNLQKLVIEVDPVTSSPDSWASNIRAGQFSRKLQKISDSDGRVCLVNGRSDWMTIDQAKKQWIADTRSSSSGY
jgi:hypothetical protein